MSSTAFLSLEDISDNLPRYDESVISVDMDETLQKAYEQLEEEIRAAMKAHRGNKSLMSILLNTLLLYRHVRGHDAGDVSEAHGQEDARGPGDGGKIYRRRIAGARYR